MNDRAWFLANNWIKPPGTFRRAPHRSDHPVFRTDHAGRLAAARTIWAEEGPELARIVVGNELADPVVREWLQGAFWRGAS